jgi:hypothetical protein
MVDDERERLRQDCDKLRQKCHELEGLLRGEPNVPEAAFRLFETMRELAEIVLIRLDRIETGTFSTTERPTEPERRRKSSGAIPAFKAERVTRELEKGKRSDG